MPENDGRNGIYCRLVTRLVVPAAVGARALRRERLEGMAASAGATAATVPMTVAALAAPRAARRLRRERSERVEVSVTHPTTAASGNRKPTRS
ncbi:hypothetical protein GCM10022287_18740 [Gryllotalpicola koreensis]|uniref:Uncharacterized protein n=1 Tax=Gryllotalpicola koreensis TaxID=993086 RepID=A0ABP8A013_9MICO